jgi:hypothetical protein
LYVSISMLCACSGRLASEIRTPFQGSGTAEMVAVTNWVLSPLFEFR